MRVKLPDSRVVQHNQYFALTIDNDVVHFQNGIVGVTKQKLKKLGITEVVEQPRPDDRYHFVSDDPDKPGSFITTPKPLDGLKVTLVGQVKQCANVYLAPTDWQVVRSIEGKPASDAVLAHRAAIRNHSNALETKVNAAKSVEDLIAIDLANWPPAN